MDIYIVEKGDTIESIGRKYNRPVIEIIEANNLTSPYLLKEGHPVLQDYLKREAQIYRELLEKLSAISDRPEIQKRIHEVEKKAEQTERAIQEMSK